MAQSTSSIVKQGFALVQSPVKRGSDGKATLLGSSAILNGKTLTGSAIEAGRVVWFPGDKLRFKGAAYKAMDRLIQSFGIAWGSGTLVPLPKLDQLKQEFADLQAKLFAEVDLLEPSFELIIDQHKAAQPVDVQEVIDQVRQPFAAFKASFVCFMPTPSVFAPLADNLSDVAQQVRDVALNEIADEASSMRDKVVGKAKVDPRSIEPIKRLVDKCRDFGIVNRGFSRLAEEFDRFAGQLTGAIIGEKQEKLAAYLTLLADPAATEAYMANQASDTDEAELETIFGGFQAPATVAAPPVMQPLPQEKAADQPTEDVQPAATPAAASAWDWESFGI